VILVDANLLIFAATKCPEQDAARSWLDGQLNGTTRVGLPWHSLLAFLRIATNLRIYGEMVASVGEAWVQVESWLSCPNVWIPQPTEKHSRVLRESLRYAGPGGNLIPDAHLAAIAMEHGLTLYSADADFGRFKGLTWINPLA
jgi:toxin-antitoxin system PIN domain toxin